MAAQTLSVTDPKANDSAGINLNTASYTGLVAGASNGVEYAWEGTIGVLLKNASGSSRAFVFTVPVPAGSGLTAIGSAPTSKTYSVADGVTQYVDNAEAFRDPTTGKVTVTVDGSGTSALAIAQ